MRASSTLVVVLLAVAVGAAADDLSRSAEHLLDAALRTARGHKVSDRTKEKLVDEATKLSDDDLRAVVWKLKETKDDLASLPEIRTLVDGVLIRRLYGEEAATRIPDLIERLDEPALDAKLELLSKAFRLEDLRLAHDLVVTDAASDTPALRGRAAIVIGSLLVWGEEGEDLTRSLAKLLEDEHPAVRTVAARAAFDARYDPVVPWAIAHLDDADEETFEMDGGKQTLRPGELALDELRTLTRIELDATFDEFHFFAPEKKKSVADLFQTWWEGKGKTFPPFGCHEAVFRPTPSVSDSRILPQGGTETSFEFWSGLDRTKIRLSVEEIQLFATGPYDWEVHFHPRYMAQGMRSDDGESWVRNHPVRSFYVLARKAIGCYVLTFQPLWEGKLKVRLRFYDLFR